MATRNNRPMGVEEYNYMVNGGTAQGWKNVLRQRLSYQNRQLGVKAPTVRLPKKTTTKLSLSAEDKAKMAAKISARVSASRKKTI